MILFAPSWGQGDDQMPTISRAANLKRHSYVERRSHSEGEFCARHNISLSKLRDLRRKGKAPRVIEVDGVRRITIEDEDAWLEANKEGGTD
jgi:hypothetical protein